MHPKPKREYLRELVAEKNRWSDRQLAEEERAIGFLGWHERGYLPHCDFPNLVQFVTFRLADSMPESRRGEWAHLLKIEDDREKRTKLEEYLDRGVGECHLRDLRVAKLAEDAMLHFHNERYELLAWCVMPNHVHVLVHVWNWSLWKMVQSWKHFVQTQAKRLFAERRPPARLVDKLNSKPPCWKPAFRWQRCADALQSRMLRNMIHDVQAIAAEVIRKTGKDKPADAALREVLKQIKDLAPFDATEVAKTVFIYYRWHVWLREERGVESKMRLAIRLNQRFQANSASVPLAELRANAVPAWTAAEMEVTDEWLLSLQREPKLWLRAKRGTAESLARTLFAADVSPLLPEAILYRGEEDLFKTPEFHAGEFEIQDIASQLVGMFCAPQPGETWWDTCAGEGGKTLHLSDLMQNKGMLWASDRAEWRLTKLKRRAGRAKVFNYRSAHWDGGAKLPTKTKFDGVLVDAPCSGIGTWQRNPQARWTTVPNDVCELSEIQKKLLTNIAPSVKPGGKLIFSVCTLTRAETVEVVEAFNASQPDFEPMMLPEISGSQSLLTSAATKMIWPQDLGGNGMFIAGWRRRKA